MAPPYLLLVDGDPVRTPGLRRALEADGWAVQAAKGDELPPFIQQGWRPDLLLVDPEHGLGRFDLVHLLRQRDPQLPVLLMADTGAQKSIGLGVQGFLERNQADGDLAVSLRRFRPDRRGRLESEDLFGDLLEELEDETPVALRVTPPSATPPTPLPIPAPAEEPPLKPPPLLQPSQLLARAASQAPVRLSPALPPSGPVSGSQPALKKDEITLSGISGVHDPFAWDDDSIEVLTPTPEFATPAAARQPEPELAPPPADSEEYGNYFLVEKIAVGGMAELFKAQQRGVQGFQKIVAIKRILPHLVDNEDFATMFIDEAKLAAQLTHPNIVQIFDLGKAASSYYIAMEYVNGRDLRTLLRKAKEYGKPFPEAVAAFVTMKVASALDYAHRKRGFDDRELKLVHRDVSPQNVLISNEGAVKLVDFGIAKAATKASHTVAGALKGKLLYMSPEQALGQPLDNRSDLYSLGLVLFEMLTGERCFQADSEMGVLEKVRMGKIGDLRAINPEISHEVADIVNRALHKSVEQRYASARLLERDLRDLLMKRGHIPAEHDIAEYLEAVLMGPKDRVEEVVRIRFPLPTAPLPPLPAVPVAAPMDAAPTLHGRSMPQALLPPPPQSALERPRIEPSMMDKASKNLPGWALFLVLAVIIGVALLAWYLFPSR
ncbi:MAG TPA: protein kinase [Holophagaceae bacterium]|jgi:serine/threonine protein kinase|nr:protein kinase [Holophagaceae bacterium]